MTGLPPSPSADVTTLYLMVGLPGAGKTTHARQVAAEQRALRLTPDDWMIPLFGVEWRDPHWAGRRDIVEGRLISMALDALRVETSVVLDFGLWSRDERSALRWLAARSGAVSHLIHVEADDEERRRRTTERFRTAPTTSFEMTADDHDAFCARFQPPDRDELSADVLDRPPPGHATWESWATTRWPSLTVD